ncbi:hypothetical protein C6P46_004159 [Rhodotorula mucilaginosa]|uniref:MIF4G domain-containing protein n=1 Tax=Rhodotorula mucilaginosa TaxID=5537 RepID=A0A9P6W2T9_RHOMI|nr:hypothetical protein C6P46_004159 [Rhodotorula mucilaginosa]TKA51840.1 hypothetical protein B0A53_05192 [Rhodotorula sp. CCFEE 5036]
MATLPEGAAAKDKEARNLRRIELRQITLDAWHRAGPPEGLGKKLDTSLKRHTALLVKLRSSLNQHAAVPALLNEISQLALEKYVEEAVGAVVEGLAKCKTAAEVAGAVEVVVALHNRFPELFTPPFSSLLLQGLKPGSPSHAADKDIQEKENNARIIKQRTTLRIVGELEAIGIVRKESGGGGKGEKSTAGMTGEITWAALRDLLTSDKEALPLVAPLAIAFAKHLGPLYLPPPPASSSGAATANPESTDEFPALAAAAAGEGGASEESSAVAPLVPREIKDKFRKLLVAYFEALGKREQKLHLELQKQDKRNHEAYIRSGEVFEDREKNYEKAVKAWERGWASVTQLSELLNLPLPTLPSLQSSLTSSFVTGAGSSTNAQNSGEEMGPQSLWADEEEKKFYEDLRELRGEVPAVILGVKDEPPPNTEEAAAKEEEGTAAAVGENAEVKLSIEREEPRSESLIEADGAAEIEDPVAKLDAPEEPDPAILPSGPAAQLTAIFARLPDASSKKAIDDIALEFALLNSKAARKRLVKTLGSVSRNRQDILPYYGRLVGTLNPYMPDIGKELVALLEDEFRYLQRKRNADLAESRSKNLRFLAELTKFRVTPVHVAFFVFKVLLDDFTGPNIDNFCTFLEGCGRFLLRSESTSERMRQVVDVYKRKRAAMNLDERQAAMLDNAYYQCDPPDRPAIPPKERTPMQLFIRHLFYHMLNRNSSDKVLKLVRKMHWEDPEVVRKLHNAFTKVWKIKYSNVHLFAVLLYDLGRFHPDFSVAVLDDVLENVRTGMEVNNFKYNQQRVATVKYLGELYNYRVVDSRVIFDTLWSLVTFGHPEGRPHPDFPTAIDAPDDYFRVRLVCTLLDTCGACFDRGTLKKKLDSFLTFFQMYVLAKGSLPMDVGFMYSDTLEHLRPKLVKFQTFPEAAVAVDEMMAAVAKAPPEPEEDEQDVEGEGQGARPGADEVDEEESETDGESEENGDVDVDAEEGSDAESETGEGRGRDPNAMTQEEEDDFTRELAKMMVSSNAETRKVPDRKPVSLDVGIPLFRRQRAEAAMQQQQQDEDEAAGEATEPKGMQFTLLTKKGNKPQALSMEIPRDSAIAMSTTQQREQNKAEQERLKRLVLNYEEREEELDKQALKESLARRGIVLNYGAENRKKGVKVQVVP